MGAAADNEDGEDKKGLDHKVDEGDTKINTTTHHLHSAAARG